MFWAGLLHIMSRIESVWTAIGVVMRCVDWLLAGSGWNRVDPPDDEQQACSKHLETHYWNKLIVNSASCWFILYGYITVHDQQNIKFVTCPKIWAANYDLQFIKKIFIGEAKDVRNTRKTFADICSVISVICSDICSVVFVVCISICGVVFVMCSEISRVMPVIYSVSLAVPKIYVYDNSRERLFRKCVV
jgi:hypothetical protein